MSRTFWRTLIAAAALVLSGCVSDAAPSATSFPTTTAALDPPPEFAWWDVPVLGEGDAALAHGVLRVDENCVYVDTVFDGSYLLVLPARQTVLDSAHGDRPGRGVEHSLAGGQHE